MLNRAYEVLRDPKLKEAYDFFGTKGVGTSAASDVDNLKRQQTSRVRRPTPSTQRSSSASSSSGFYPGNAGFGRGWPSGTGSSPFTNTDTRKNGQSVRANNAEVRKPSESGSYNTAQTNGRTSAPSSQRGSRVVNPNPVGGPSVKRSSTVGHDTSVGSRSTSNRNSFRVDPSVFSNDPGFPTRPHRSATETSSSSSTARAGRDYTSGPKADDKTAFYGDMGTIHTQPTKDMGKSSVFVPRDGMAFISGEAFFGRGPKFGRDVLVDVEIDEKTAKAGGRTKVIEVKHMGTCTDCGGLGTRDPTSTISTCRHCGGSGHVMNSSQMRETCPVCLGTGCSIANPCGSCQGLGIQQTATSVDVVIPKQVDDGFTMRIAGQGDAGPNGGPAGDLYVCFRIPVLRKKTKEAVPEESQKVTKAPASVPISSNNYNNESAPAAPHENKKPVKESPLPATLAADQEEVVPGKSKRRRIRNFLGGVASSILSN